MEFVDVSRCVRCRPGCHCVHQCNIIYSCNLNLIHFVLEVVIVSHSVLQGLLYVLVLLCQEGLRTILPSGTAPMCTCDRSLVTDVVGKCVLFQILWCRTYGVCHCFDAASLLQLFADFVKFGCLLHVFRYDGYKLSCCSDGGIQIRLSLCTVMW